MHFEWSLILIMNWAIDSRIIHKNIYIKLIQIAQWYKYKTIHLKISMFRVTTTKQPFFISPHSQAKLNFKLISLLLI